MNIKQRKLIRRELLNLQLREKELEQTARNAKQPQWKALLEKQIPEKVYEGLKTAFGQGFSLVFRQGRGIIELTYRKEQLQQEHRQRSEEVKAQGSRTALRQMHKSARRSDNRNMAATTAEGVALGVLGVGMPDIVLFLSTLLKGVYETAIHYGFDYVSPEEQYLILKMLAVPLKTGAGWAVENRRVDTLLTAEEPVTEEMLKKQIQDTASLFAMDMLLLKFIQGLPVVGFLGGAANPVYYQKIMAYVQLKYKKRYLLKQL